MQLIVKITVQAKHGRAEWNTRPPNDIYPDSEKRSERKFLFSYENEGPEGPEPREQVGRTVLVYIVGDNGVSELSSLFKVNFSDMKAGMEEVDYSKCNLVVYSEMDK